MSSYIKSLNILNVEKTSEVQYKILDLFAGCGGLALGFESLGFVTEGYETNLDSVQTYNENLNGKCHQVYLDTDTQFDPADVIIGGPPCQPFSVGGNQKGLKDSRDGFPAYLAAVKQVKPKLCLIENVRGMIYRNKKYLIEIVNELKRLGYIVDIKILKAVEHGVPQNRERILIVGHYGGFQFPNPSKDKVTAGEALTDIAFKVDTSTKFLTASQDQYIANYERVSKCINPRDLHMDRPARTLTCRNLAGATGDMHRIKLSDGRRKRLTINEAARLQSFPDWFEFVGKEGSVFKQIGNAVPPLMAIRLAKSVLNYLNGETSIDDESIQKELAL